MREDAKPTYRRTKRTAVAAGAITLLTFLATDPGAAAPGAPTQAAGFNPGTGNAIALGYKVNPVAGNLSFGITAGESIAGHQNTGATGQSRAINLGVIGVTLAGEGCDGGSPTLPESQQPQPLVVTSADEGAAQGKTAKEAEVITKSARATPDPFAEAITEIAPLGDRSTIYIGGGRTVTHSGVVADGVREALARTEIAEVVIAGGAIKLKGLTWQAVHRSGAEEAAEGSFRIEGLEIGGQRIPIPDDLLDQLEVVNQLLGVLGVEITAPEVRVEEGIVFVDPLKIAIVPNTLRDSLTQPLFELIQPVREDLTDLLLEVDCGNSTYITVVDLVLGSVSGAGSLGLELGGVQATTAELNAFEFPQLPPPPDVAPAAPAPATPAPPSTGAGFASAPVPSPVPAPAVDDEVAAPAPAVDELDTSPIADVVGERGGLMALVAGGGLAALLATAEGDRRKMRRAQREIPLEA